MSARALTRLYLPPQYMTFSDLPCQRSTPAFQISCGKGSLVWESDANLCRDLSASAVAVAEVIKSPSAVMKI